MSQCHLTHKKCHDTAKTADVARRKTVLKNIRNGVIGKNNRVLNTYQCLYCNFWHVGHSIVKKVPK